MKYFMKKIEKMLKSENDDVALQNRILEAFLKKKAFKQLKKSKKLLLGQFLINSRFQLI